MEGMTMDTIEKMVDNTIKLLDWLTDMSTNLDDAMYLISEIRANITAYEAEKDKRVWVDR